MVRVQSRKLKPISEGYCQQKGKVLENSYPELLIGKGGWIETKITCQ